ncbi:MAG: MlaE family ABC transporter permease [Thiohalorhabdus sp.]|uniref:MlaE family ABC transporter permease n=1 Tax=Thiohalorhabdus sp. TaxID=3094134 RepID=UPI00398065B9
MAPSPPTIHLHSVAGGVRAKPTGRWALLTAPRDRRRARDQLAALARPRAMGWDLRGIEGIDTAGALLLWRAWGRRLPADLRLHPYQENIFRRLERPAAPTTPAEEVSPGPLVRLGAAIALVLGRTADLTVHAGQVLLAGLHTLTHPRSVPWTELAATVYKAGYRAVPLVILVNFLVGLVMAYQIGLAISRYGPNTALVGVFGTAVLREIAPWVTAIIVAGRTGSAITAEIGAMHLTREMLALRTLGISPVLRLALPRVAALAVTVPLLVVLGGFFAVLGGMVIAEPALGMAPGRFLERLPHDVPPVNFWIGMIKGASNGVIIGVVASFFGLHSAPNTESLSRRTTASVVTGLATVLVLDAAIGALFVDVGLL